MRFPIFGSISWNHRKLLIVSVAHTKLDRTMPWLSVTQLLLFLWLWLQCLLKCVEHRKHLITTGCWLRDLLLVILLPSDPSFRRGEISILSDIFGFFLIAAEELSLLFEKKNFRVKPQRAATKPSILSVRLEQCPLQLNNPFNEYSKFDGKVSRRERDQCPPLKRKKPLVSGSLPCVFPIQILSRF